MKIIFDFGGVLVDLDKPTVLKAFAQLGVDLLPYLGTYQQGGVFSQLENGDIPLPTFYDEIRKISTLNPKDVEIKEAWESYLLGIPEIRLEKLLQIKKHYPLFLLSNTNIIHWQQSQRDFFSWNGLTVSNFFDGLFLSYERHLQKPDPHFFNLVTKELDCRPEEILFFDDSEKNCHVAQQYGWNIRHVSSSGEWISNFDEFGHLRHE